MRKTIRAGDLPPDTPITEGSDEEPEQALPPPGSEFWEVWEGNTYNKGYSRNWPPRRRVRQRVGTQKSAESKVTAFDRADADEYARTEGKSTRHYYVVVKVTMNRELVGEHG